MHSIFTSKFHPIDLTSIFLIVWIASTMQSVGCCDQVLDVDRLSADGNYRAALSRWLASIGCPIDFSDCASPASTQPPFGSLVFERLVREAAQAIRSNASSLVIAEPAAVATRRAALSERSNAVLELAIEGGDG